MPTAGIKRVPHARDDPWRLIDAVLEAGHARGALGHGVLPAVGERDLEVEDAALNAHPLGAGGRQGVGLAGVGGAQLLRAAADACQHRRAAPGLDVVELRLHA